MSADSDDRMSDLHPQRTVGRRAEDPARTHLVGKYARRAERAEAIRIDAQHHHVALRRISPQVAAGDRSCDEQWSAHAKDIAEQLARSKWSPVHEQPAADGEPRHYHDPEPDVVAHARHRAAQRKDAEH